MKKGDNSNSTDDVVMSAQDDDNTTSSNKDTTTAAAKARDPVEAVVQEVMNALVTAHYTNGHTGDATYRGVTRAIRRFGYLRQNLKFQLIETLVAAALDSPRSPLHSAAPPAATDTKLKQRTAPTPCKQPPQQQQLSSPSLTAALTTPSALALLNTFNDNLKSAVTTLLAHAALPPTAAAAGVAPGATDAVDDHVMEENTPPPNATSKTLVKLDTLEVWVNTVGYLSLLVLTKLLDCKLYPQAVELSNSIVSYLEALPRKALDDNIAAKLFYFHSRSYELNGNFKDVRPTMLAAYRFAAMHHDSTKQAVALNCLLRNYIVYRHYQLAIKLVSKATLPDGLRNNSQTARFLYYLGRLQAVQQDYSDAHASLTEAIGKAPAAAPPPVPLPTTKPKDTTTKDKKDKNTTGTDKKSTGTDKKGAGTDKKGTGTEKKSSRVAGVVEGTGREESTVGTLLDISRPKSKATVRARGFRLSAHKFCVVVELLMGGIPDRALFNQSDLRKDLMPYRRIVQAVRSGELSAFSKTMDDYRSLFEHDGTLFLIVRLHRSVILAGIRTINASYSYIALGDVARKLGLDTAEEAEGVASKAIAGSVIDAQIDHDAMTIRSKRVKDVYTSNEPSEELDKRTKFCIQLYNEAVQAMEYPDDSKPVEDTVQEASDRRKEMQEQLARAEEDDDGGEGDLL